MSETIVRPVGTGSVGEYISGENFTLDDANQMRIMLNKLANATLQRNVWMGGFAFSNLFSIPVSSDTDYDLLNWTTPRWDNRSTQFSAFSDSKGASLSRLIRFYIRVSNASISATPKIRYGTTVAGATTVGTLTGAAACSATSSDYSGTNQIQELTLTLPTGLNYFKPQVTVSGTGGNPYEVWCMAIADLFVDSTP